MKIDRKWLNDIRFADDTVLISQSREELREMVEEFQEKSRGSGQKINTGKTVTLSNEISDIRIYIEGKEI